MYGGDGLARVDRRAIPPRGSRPSCCRASACALHAQREKPGLIRAHARRNPGAVAGARGAAVPVFRALRRMPLPARVVRSAARRQARHPRGGVVASGEDRVAGGDRDGGGRAVGLSQSRAVAYRERDAGIPRGALAQAVRDRSVPHRSPKFNAADRRAERDDAARPPLAAIRAFHRTLYRRSNACS